MKITKKIGANIVARDFLVTSQRAHGAREPFVQFITYSGIKSIL